MLFCVWRNILPPLFLPPPLLPLSPLSFAFINPSQIHPLPILSHPFPFPSPFLLSNPNPSSAFSSILSPSPLPRPPPLLPLAPNPGMEEDGRHRTIANQAPSHHAVVRRMRPRGMPIIVAIASIFCCGWTGSFALGEIAVKIERHFPCSPASGPNKDQLRIKFPSYKSTGVNFKEEKDEAGHKCFQMSGGKVEVYSPGLESSKKYYVHVETRIGIHGKPERCVNPDKDNCGGIGSCVHCDICQTMGGSLRNFIQILKGDKPAECSAEGLPAGTYDDLALRVCLPSKEELLPFLDQNSSRAEQLWDIFVSSRARSGGEIPLVIAARIFDRPINKLSIKELNDALHGSKQGMIGCHWIYATVKSVGQ